MIKIKKSGDLLKENVDALVNTVNCVGIMGKGVALQFKMAFPDNFTTYKKACDNKEVQIGEMFICKMGKLFNPKYIINFPTKKHWKEKSRIEYIQKGLEDLTNKTKELNIRSIAIPPLGTGSGGLDWADVKPLIESKLRKLSDVQVILFAPSKSPEANKLKIETKKPKMTQGRAFLISLLENYKKAGYKTTLLEIQKLMYFLQESGVKLRLQYEKARYGPYANNLHHVLQIIERHYIKGYGDRTYSSQISILPEGIEKAHEYMKEHPQALGNFKKVLDLIEGFETPYGLELLSTVHWTIKKEKICEIRKILRSIQNWNPRKKWLFSIIHIQVAKQRLEEKKFT